MFKKKIRIAVIIACRLKSKRLARKALIKIDNNFSLIDKCITSSKLINSNFQVILATSNLKQDKPLINVAKKNNIKYVKGSAENVISRYLKACKNFKIDTVIRVTGDCPYISKEIAELLLNKHFKSKAEFTRAKKFPIGASCEIINTKALKKLLKYKRNPLYSEYMSFYFLNNPKIFKINNVNLPKWMIKSYRLTVDYFEDIKFFRKVYSHFRNKNLDFNLKNLYKFLKKNPNIPDINSNLAVKYLDDKKLINSIYNETKFKKK